MNRDPVGPSFSCPSETEEVVKNAKEEPAIHSPPVHLQVLDLGGGRHDGSGGRPEGSGVPPDGSGGPPDGSITVRGHVLRKI